MVVQLRLNNDQHTCDFLTELLNSTGQITNSKAFMTAAEERKFHLYMIETQKAELERLQIRVNTMISLFEKMDSSARDILEVISQGDLIDG